MLPTAQSGSRAYIRCPVWPGFPVPTSVSAAGLESPGIRAECPALPCLPPPSLSAVQRERQQHPASNSGLRERRGAEKQLFSKPQAWGQLSSQMGAKFMPALHCDPAKHSLYLKRKASLTNSHKGACGGTDVYH